MTYAFSSSFFVILKVYTK